jgi:hypothetical protein
MQCYGMLRPHPQIHLILYPRTSNKLNKPIDRILTMGYEECLMCAEKGAKELAVTGYNDSTGFGNLYCDNRECFVVMYATHADHFDMDWLNLQRASATGWWEYYYNLYAGRR